MTYKKKILLTSDNILGFFFPLMIYLSVNLILYIQDPDLPYGWFKYDFYHQKSFEICTVIKTYKRSQGYEKADEQSKKKKKDLEMDWYDLETNWNLRPKESNVTLNFMVCFIEKKMSATNGIILPKKWEMNFEVQMASLTVDMLEFQLIFVDGKILECQVVANRCTKFRSKYRWRITTQVIEFYVESAFNISKSFEISKHASSNKF